MNKTNKTMVALAVVALPLAAQSSMECHKPWFSMVAANVPVLDDNNLFHENGGRISLRISGHSFKWGQPWFTRPM